MDVTNYANIERAQHNYDTPRTVYVSITNTISSLGLVGKDGYADGYGKGIQDSLIGIPNLGSQILKLNDYCFYGCKNLRSMTDFEYIKYYGDYCFVGCDSLNNFGIGSITTTLSTNDYLSSEGPIIYSIGESAFEGTNIEWAVLDIRGIGFDNDTPVNTIDSDYQGCQNYSKDTGPYIGNFAFKNCKKLTDVVFKCGVMLSQGMFEGCTALSSVIFDGYSNHGSCVYDNAFKDCTALKSITLPKHWEALGESMFEGCTSLSNLIFDNLYNLSVDSDEYYGLKVIENNCLSGTQITTLTIPNSIDDLNRIEDYAFTGLPRKLSSKDNNDSLEFIFEYTGDSTNNSIYDYLNDNLTLSSSTDTTTSAEIIKNSVSTVETITTNNFNYNDILTKKSLVEISFNNTETQNFKAGGQYVNHSKEAVTYADANNIPIMLWITASVGCGYCTDYKKNVYNIEGFQKWCQQSGIIFSMTVREYDGSGKGKGNAQYTNFEADQKWFVNFKNKKFGGGTQAKFPYLIFHWKSKSGKEYNYHWHFKTWEGIQIYSGSKNWQSTRSTQSTVNWCTFIDNTIKNDAAQANYVIEKVEPAPVVFKPKNTSATFWGLKDQYFKFKVKENSSGSDNWYWFIHKENDDYLIKQKIN